MELSPYEKSPIVSHSRTSQYFMELEGSLVCSTNGGGDECIRDIGGKVRRKETTRKTKAQVDGYY
jgi:hypothetical protein